MFCYSGFQLLSDPPQLSRLVGSIVGESRQLLRERLNSVDTGRGKCWIEAGTGRQLFFGRVAVSEQPRFLGEWCAAEQEGRHAG